MPRILVADPLAEDGLERLRRAGDVTVVSKLQEDELIRRIPEFDALVVRSETRVTASILEAGRKLRVVGRAGVGVDNIDVPTGSVSGRWRRTAFGAASPARAIMPTRKAC